MIFNQQMAFIHVPKTGGMTVTRVLLEVLRKPLYCSHPHEDVPDKDNGIRMIPGIRHETMQEASDLMHRYGFDITKSPMILAAVRNPYELEVSRYAYLKRGHTWDRGPNQNLAWDATFEEFALYSEPHGGNERGIEAYYLLRGVLPPNLRVIRTERMEVDLAEAMGSLDIALPASLPRDNASAHEDYRKYYTNASEKAVFERYRWVFESGYYPRMAAEQVPPQPAVIPSTLFPMRGPVRLVGAPSGFWFDSWIGDALIIKVRPSQTIESVTLQGRFPLAFCAAIDVSVVNSGSQSITRLSPSPSFCLTLPCALPADRESEVHFRFSNTFKPSAMVGNNDDRDLSFLLTELAFT